MNKIESLVRMLVPMFFVIGFCSCEHEVSEFVQETETRSIADFIYEDPENYDCFRQLAERGKLMDALAAYNPNGNSYTLFLPSDAAFEKFFQASDDYKNIEEMLMDTSFTKALGRYHVLNIEMKTNDFPFGAFPDTTMSGDLLTVGFSSQGDSALYLINNIAPITRKNIEAKNGYIHELGEVLQPVVFTSYEMLKQNQEYSILAAAFETTGVVEQMGLTRTTEEGQTVENYFTLWAEPDSVFRKKGINNLDDLIDHLDPRSNDYTDEDNEVYQFAAYHIMEGRYFLDNFEGLTNYATFASLPIRIEAGVNLKINYDRNRIFDTLIEGTDTTLIDYIEPYYDYSNILSMNGPVHFINQVMELYKPSLAFKLFQFYEDPVINDLKNRPNEYIFKDPEKFTQISWDGVDELIYTKLGTNDKARGNDYLTLDGDFTITYKIPKILPGTYTVLFHAHAYSSSNAVVELYIDGNKIGGIINLTSGGKGSNPYIEYNQNNIEFATYQTHTVEVRNLIPGRMIWDYIAFEPI